MASSDFIADFLTVVRNAARAKKDKATIKSSRSTARIAELFKEEGFVENVKVFTEDNRKFIRIHMKYLHDGRPAIQGIKRISKPGLRIYRGSDQLPRVQGGLGIAIISTSKGIMTDRQARKDCVGGEVLCTVW